MLSVVAVVYQCVICCRCGVDRVEGVSVCYLL